MIPYDLPDSIKAVQFLAELKTNFTSNYTKVRTGIQTDIVKLFLEKNKKETQIVFAFPESATVLSQGMYVTKNENGSLSYPHNLALDSNYKLMISIATDSAGNFSLYSGYAWLPVHSKWKLIGTCKISNRWSTIMKPAVFFYGNKKEHGDVKVSQAWIQRNTGSWKDLDGKAATAPVVNLFGHIDSTVQRKAEVNIIEKAIAAGQLDTKDKVQEVYYKLLRQGTGAQVDITDTVTAFYRLTLLNDTALIDGTKDKPATFALNRLIRGWQIGVPLCKVGCKIKLVIPSDMAYSIRTRSPKIPPNSILVFEIEVVETKPVTR